MVRSKVRIAFITKDSTRKATYNRRKNGLLKKVSELSNLCGISACAIVSSPYHHEPKVWPSPLGVQNIIAQFRAMPEIGHAKEILNQETFLKQRILKVDKQLKNKEDKDHEKAADLLMFESLSIGKERLESASLLELIALRTTINQKLEKINERLEAINMAPQSEARNQPPSPIPVSLATQLMMPIGSNSNATKREASASVDVELTLALGYGQSPY